MRLFLVGLFSLSSSLLVFAQTTKDQYIMVRCSSTLGQVEIVETITRDIEEKGEALLIESTLFISNKIISKDIESDATTLGSVYTDSFTSGTRIFLQMNSKKKSGRLYLGRGTYNDNFYPMIADLYKCI